MRGTLKVVGDASNLDFDSPSGLEQCSGLREYRALGVGTTLILVDAEGEELASADVLRTTITRRGRDSRICEMPFVFTTVTESSSYGIEIPGLGVATVERSELGDGVWSVTITIGPPE